MTTFKQGDLVEFETVYECVDCYKVNPKYVTEIPDRNIISWIYSKNHAEQLKVPPGDVFVYLYSFMEKRIDENHPRTNWEWHCFLHPEHGFFITYFVDDENLRLATLKKERR